MIDENDEQQVFLGMAYCLLLLLRRYACTLNAALSVLRYAPASLQHLQLCSSPVVILHDVFMVCLHSVRPRWPKWLCCAIQTQSSP